MIIWPINKANLHVFPSTLASAKYRSKGRIPSVPVGVSAGRPAVSRPTADSRRAKAGTGRQEQAQLVQVAAVHAAPRHPLGDRCSISLRSGRQPAWCEGPPMVNGGRGVAPDPFLLDPELRHHIQNCPCPCNHMGYGNFLDYQVGDHFHS